MCTYKKESNEPCETCPKLMSALYKCELLKEIQEENKPF